MNAETDIHGIRVINGVAHLSPYKEIAVLRFSSVKHKPEELPALREKYIQQANELVSAFLRIEKENAPGWIRDARFLLGKADYALRQAYQVDFCINHGKKTQK